MALLERLRAWWNKDAVEQAEEDSEARTDDIAAQTHLGGGEADYERDSEPPPDETEPGR
jgi:hypothetical protein